MTLAISEEEYQRHRQWVADLKRTHPEPNHAAVEAAKRWKAYIDANPRWWEHRQRDQPPAA